MNLNKCFLFFIIGLVTSCGVGQKLKKADKYYEAGAYYQAAKLYPKIAPKLKDKSKRPELYFRAAECYRKIGNAQMAERNYDQAIRLKYQDPVAFLYSAQMSLMTDKKDAMEKAEKQLDNFQKLESTDPRGILLRGNINYIKENKGKTNGYKVENMKEFNSRYHDFSPMYASGDYERIYFTSSRKEGKGKSKIYDVTGETNANFFSIETTRKGWTKPEPISDAMNTVDEEGAGVFNNAFNQMFYTQCRKERGESLGCDILAISRQNEAWGEPQELLLVDTSMVAAHPALSEDGLTMYFCSNIPGGVGGLDLWMVTRSSETDLLWSTPIHLGNEINTPGNEMFPTVRKDTLYFSSDGHVGFGGLDIFKAFQKDDKWIILNMGQPINSNADDFGLIAEIGNERGFFTSRRKGGKGGDDIYSFQKDIPIVEFYVSGFVRDEKTKAKIANAEIRLIGSNGAIIKKKSETKEEYQFRLQEDTEYFITVSKQGYFSKKSQTFSTKGLKQSKNFHEDILLASFARPVEIPNIFFEFGKADLSKTSTAALDELIKIMDDNPTIVVELRAHTDSKGTEEVNQILSQRRAQAVVDYLIRYGVDEARMKARGYGKSQPRIVSTEIVSQYTFLKEGQVLTEEFIKNLTPVQQEICNGLNRRTEIQVISDRYNPE